MSNIKNLVREFIDSSPDFYSDLTEGHDIDNKHNNIISSAYTQIESELNENNFRNWGGQSDFGAPAQITLEMFNQHGVLYTLFRYLYLKLFMFQDEKNLLSFLLDDVAVIEQIGGDKFLLNNKVHETLGVGKFYQYKKYSFNMRWLRYIYILTRVQKYNMLSGNDLWVDVGSYYGGLQGLVKKYNPNVRMILVDFHHQLCRSYIYLHDQYPDALHILPDQVAKYGDFSSLPDGAIVYLPAMNFNDFSYNEVHLATNFFSLGEMKEEFFMEYMNSNIFKKSKFSYLVNRFVSAPFFESTYPGKLSILDYLQDDRDVSHFDVFPVHQYMLTKRELFGRKAFRNTSSSHFELITHNK
jgi:putative sugar O-methyltransferase